MDTDPPPEQLFSLAALHRAWRLVRRSGPSAGTDRVTPHEFEQRLEDELTQLRHDILSGQYRPKPVIVSTCPNLTADGDRSPFGQCGTGSHSE